MEDACRREVLSKSFSWQRIALGRVPACTRRRTNVSAAVDELDDFPGFSVALQLLLGEEEPAVHYHFEHAASRLDQLNVGVRESTTKLGRQTGGPGLVVSNDAVFDRHAHL
jgi:hypothetical protein